MISKEENDLLDSFLSNIKKQLVEIVDLNVSDKLNIVVTINEDIKLKLDITYRKQHETTWKWEEEL